MKHVGDATKTTVLLKKGRKGWVVQKSSLVHPSAGEKAGALPPSPKGSPELGQRRGECLFEQPETLRGPWCPSISQFLLSRGELKAAEVMSHRSCAALSPLKSSFQLVIFMRPHNNPGNC